MKTATEPRTLYLAIWKDQYGQTDPLVLVCEAKFERKPKSWRRVEQKLGVCDAANSAWSYKTNFSGEKPPGFATPGEAVQALLDRTRSNIEHKEKTLAFEKRRLATVEDYLRGLSR